MDYDHRLPAVTHNVIAALFPISFAALAPAAFAQPTCADGDRAEFEVGVYLPSGSPTIRLKVRNEAGIEQWDGEISTAATVSGSSGCHWAGHVGEASPDSGDPLRVELPANEILTFEFSPLHASYGRFHYQLCRGASAPFESFRCPQAFMDASADSTGVLFVYDSSFQGKAAMRVVVPSIMSGSTGTIDTLVPGPHWLLPYDLEQACGNECGEAPNASGCEPAEAEGSTPYLRRLDPNAGPIYSNPNALWVIRAGRDVTWRVEDLGSGTNRIEFDSEACVQVDGSLDIEDLTLSGRNLAGWWGIGVREGGSLRLGPGTLVAAAGDLREVEIPGAVRTHNGEIELDGAILSGNFAGGLYVGGTHGTATIRGGSIISLSGIPDPIIPATTVAGTVGERRRDAHPHGRESRYPNTRSRGARDGSGDPRHPR